MVSALCDDKCHSGWLEGYWQTKGERRRSDGPAALPRRYSTAW